MTEDIQSLTLENIDAFIANNDGIIIFHKKLCPNCKVMGKVLLKVQTQNPNIALAAIDTEEETALKEKFGVERVPTLLAIKQGAQKTMKTAVMNPKEVLAFYAEA